MGAATLLPLVLVLEVHHTKSHYEQQLELDIVLEIREVKPGIRLGLSWLRERDRLLHAGLRE